jgi:tetratricopeptide (TPR) repeat protein
LFAALISLAIGTIAVDEQRRYAAYQQKLATEEATAAAFAKQQRIRDISLQMAREQLKLGSVAADKGQHADAVAIYQEALAQLEALMVNSSADESISGDLAGGYLNLGISLGFLDKSSEACPYFQEAINLHRHAIAIQTANIARKRSLSLTLNKLSQTHYGLGHFADAEVEMRESIRIREDICRAVPENTEHALDLVAGLADLGTQLTSRLRYHDAELAYRRALTECESLAARSVDKPEVQICLGELYVNFAGLQVRQKQWADADALCRKAISIAGQLKASSVDSPRAIAVIGNALSRYGDVQLDRDLAGALEYYDRAIQTLEPAFEKTPSDAGLREAFGHALEQRAAAKMWLNRLGDAQADWRAAAAIEPEKTRPAQLARWGMLLARAGFVTDAIYAIDPLLGPHATAETIYQAARIYARISVVTHDDDDDYSGRALELLRLAEDKGYRDIELLNNDEELAPLRERREFKKLVAR